MVGIALLQWRDSVDTEIPQPDGSSSHSSLSTHRDTSSDFKRFGAVGPSDLGSISFALSRYLSRFGKYDAAFLVSLRQ